jgi:hypothetical protein
VALNPILVASYFLADISGEASAFRHSCELSSMTDASGSRLFTIGLKNKREER